MANDIDIVTLEEAKQAIGSSLSRSGDVDERLERWITAVSQRIDDLYGAVVQRTVTDEVHYAAGGLDSIVPRYQPVVSISALTEYVNGTGTVLTAEDFDTVGTYRLIQDADSHRIYRRSGWLGFPYQGVVKLTYVAGRYSSTETVDAKYKVAAEGVLIGMWAKYASAWARGGDPLAEPVFFDEVDAVLTRWLGTRTPVIV